MNTAIGFVMDIPYVRYADGSVSRVYFEGDSELTEEQRLTNQKEFEQAWADVGKPITPEGRISKLVQDAKSRISEHVEEIAGRHLAEMKASWRWKSYPGFIAEEVAPAFLWALAFEAGRSDEAMSRSNEHSMDDVVVPHDEFKRIGVVE